MNEKPILFSAPMVRAILAGKKTQTRRNMNPQPRDGFMPVVGRYNRNKVDRLTGEQYPDFVERFGAYDEDQDYPCPYGAPGSRLWVKETWNSSNQWNAVKPTDMPEGAPIFYGADYDTAGLKNCGPWRPSLFMRRWMSRITLEITSVRVERLQDISEADAKAEGVTGVRSPDMLSIFTTKGYACDITPDHIHGVPKAGDIWMGHKVTNVVPNPGSLLDTARDSYRKLWRDINGPDSWELNPWVWVIEFRRVEKGAAA